MDFRHLCRRRRAARADRPDGLVGDHEIGRIRPLGQRSGQLAQNDFERGAGVALGQGFADAGNGAQARPPRGGDFGVHVGIAFAMVGAPFGMADDGVAAAQFRQHLGGDVAGMRARRRGMAILRAELHGAPREGVRDGNQMDERRADQNLGPLGLRQNGDRGSERRRIGLAAVHLPVSGDEFAGCRHRGAFATGKKHFGRRVG